MKSEFISVELALHTDDESSEWVRWFHDLDNHVVKTTGTDAKWLIYFAPLPSESADSTIRRLCTELQELPEEIRRYWTRAKRREFFLGYQAGFDWPCLDDRLSHETLNAVTELDAGLRFAIYPACVE